MVKGCQRQMVVIRCPADSIFESAHLILKNDAISLTREDIVRQANRVIAENALSKEKKRTKKIMWFLISIAALLCWSGSDMFSKIGSRPSDKLSHWKMVMAVGLVMGLHAAYEVFIGGVEISWDVIVAYLPASVMYILSMTLGYVGLRYI